MASELSQLQKLAQRASENKTSEEKISDLTRSFELFSRETARLESAYRLLQQKFKTVNLELDQANRKMNSILGNMTQGILFIELSGMVSIYNESAERILEIKKTDIFSCSYWDTFEDKIFGFSMQEALTTKKAPETTSVSLKRKEGSKQELEVSTTFVSKGDPSMQGLIVLLRDITEIRHLQVIANRNDRMKELGEMAASVAHEIRNPLGGIKGFASLLCRDLKDRPELKNMAEYIVEGARTLDRLVTAVLNYSRHQQMHIAPVDVTSLLHTIADLVKADDNLNHNLIVTLETSQKDLTIPLDAQMFKNALLNLIVNATQAMPEGGSITLSATTKEQQAIIAVSDTGVGIAKENLEKIFSPFFTTKTQGNGFGLAEVHKIIQAHNGVIEVESEENRGTTFTMKIPLTRL